jgi:hypothetical protein
VTFVDYSGIVITGQQTIRSTKDAKRVVITSDTVEKREDPTVLTVGDLRQAS